MVARVTSFNRAMLEAALSRLKREKVAEHPTPPASLVICHGEQEEEEAMLIMLVEAVGVTAAPVGAVATNGDAEEHPACGDFRETVWSLQIPSRSHMS